ncbi:hypothetical protein [Nitrospira sp. Kam-Ns4a]
MRRYRNRRSRLVRSEAILRRSLVHTFHQAPPGPSQTGGSRSPTGEAALAAQWAALHHACADRASRVRLARLWDRLRSRNRGALESAAAEVSLAAQLLQAGCAVGFLPESQAKTADLECMLGSDRFFVEVTAMVGSGGSRRLPTHAAGSRQGPDEGSDGQVLVNRIVARIVQKARQLTDYCEPVVLAITIPYPDTRVPTLDIRHLAGTVSMILPLVRQVSAVLLSLWQVTPSPARSAVRLANVWMVERSPQQSRQPRVQLLVANPAPGYPLSRRGIQLLARLL